MFTDLIIAITEKNGCVNARNKGSEYSLRPDEQITFTNLSVLQFNANYSTCAVWTSLPNLYHILELSSKSFM